jgi:hypothetical protein
MIQIFLLKVLTILNNIYNKLETLGSIKHSQNNSSCTYQKLFKTIRFLLSKSFPKFLDKPQKLSGNTLHNKIVLHKKIVR